jgi:hypothetical protein
MSSRTKKISRVIAIVLVALLLLVAVLLLALQTEEAKSYVLDEATTRVNDQLAGEFQAERLSGPLLWGASLHDVVLRDDRGELVMDADRVDVGYSLVPLLFGDREIDRVELVGMHLVVQRYPDETFNVQQVTEPEPSERSLIIDEVRVVDGNLIYEDRSEDDKPRVIVAESIDAIASLEMKPDDELEAFVDSAEFDLVADALPGPMSASLTNGRVERLEGRVDMSASEFVLDDSVRFAPLELAAHMAPEADDGVERVDITGRWNSDAVSWENTRARDSRGRIEARLTAPDSAEAAWRISSNIQTDVSGLQTEDVQAERLTADLSVAGVPTQPGESLNYELDATMADALYKQVSAEDVAIDLSGRVVNAAEDSDEAVQSLSARGVVGLSEVHGPKLSTRRIDIDVDLEGPTDELLGSLGAEFELLSLGEESFTTARLDLGLEPQRRFDLETSAIPTVGPDFRVFAQAAGQLTDEPTGAALTAFEAGRPELSWRLREPARVVAEDDRLVVEGMTLRAGPLSTDLDGTYPLSGDAFASIVDQLALTHLDDLLDLDDVRERLPEGLREELPDAPEEEIREEIRRRLPLPDL